MNTTTPVSPEPAMYAAMAAEPYARPRMALLAIALGLGGCASLPADHGRSQLDALIQPALPALAQADDEVPLAERLNRPLGADDAVELAWRESPRVRTVIAGLGADAADLFEARRLRNPRLSGSRIGEESTVGVSMIVSDLLTLPARSRGGRARWQAALAQAAQTLVDEAAATRADYYRYLAAEQVATMRGAVAEAAATSAELAQRFRDAGNISALQLAREQAAATVARTVAAQARAERLAARMALAERLGLAGRSNRWRVPDRLPLPPIDGEPPIDALLALARDQRHDLGAARAALEAGEHDLALARGTRLLGDIEFGFEREHEDGRRRSGPALSLELPVFQQGQAGVARARSQRELAHGRLAQAELALERQVRTGLARLASQREIVQAYRQALIPQREAIVAGEQERYNFMLIGAFELIAAKQQEYDAYQGYLEAIRDYWLARVDLARAIGGPLPGGEAEADRAPSVEEILSPAASGHEHPHHDHRPQRPREPEPEPRHHPHHGAMP